MKSKPNKQPEGRFNYKKLIEGNPNRYVEWTGKFYTRKQAEKWFSSYGSFHAQNGHTLQLFCGTELIK